MQVIYPDTVAEMEAGGWRDEDLAAVLDTVSLGHILTREGGWDAAADWKVTIVTVSGNYLHYLSTSVNELFMSWTVSRNVVIFAKVRCSSSPHFSLP